MPYHRSHADNVETMAQLIAGLLPSLALEARISGGNPIGDQLVTQLGLSVQAAQNVDMAILARTSGTAFVVGISSIMAYKLFCRLAKSNCLWSSIDQLIQQQLSSSSLVSSSSTTTTATVDDPSSSPSRTVQLTDGFYAVRLGGENELLRKLDECFCRKDSGGSSTAVADGAGTARADEQLAVVQIRHGRSLRRLLRQNQRIQREGIEALQEEEHGQHNTTRGILLRAERQQRPERDDDEESMISNLTSASRIPPNPCAVDRVPPLQLPPDDTEHRCASAASHASSPSSASSTPVSALLHCPNADELCWENEFSSASEAGDGPPYARAAEEFDGMGDTEGLFLFRERCNSLGSISQLSAMKNLERMFRGMPQWHGETNWEDPEMGQQQQHRLVDNALDNLRELDRLDANTNVSSSMLSSGRMARRCWLDMEGTDGTRGPGSAAYKIAGSKSDLDISEMSSSSICSRSQMVAVASEHGRKTQHKQQCKSHGLWELTSLNFSSTPTTPVTVDDQHTGDCNRIYSRFTHEKHTRKAIAAATTTNADDPGIRQHWHRGDEADNDGAEDCDDDNDEGMVEEQYQQQPHRQQQHLLLLTPVPTVATGTATGATTTPSNSSSTMVDSVISCHSSLASTSAFSTRQRSSNSAVMGTLDHGRGVMFDSAIVSDGGAAQSNLGFGHAYDGEEEVEGDTNDNGLSETPLAQNQQQTVANGGTIIRRVCPPPLKKSPGRQQNNTCCSEHATPVGFTSHQQRLHRQHQAVAATQPHRRERHDSSPSSLSSVYHGSEKSLEWF